MSLLLGVAVIVLVAIAVLPVIADPEERRLWKRRFLACVTCGRRSTSSIDRPSVSRHRRRGRNASSNRGDGGARYILSTEQEEEIRDAFLKDRLEAAGTLSESSESDEACHQHDSHHTGAVETNQRGDEEKHCSNAILQNSANTPCDDKTPHETTLTAIYPDQLKPLGKLDGETDLERGLDIDSMDQAKDEDESSRLPEGMDALASNEGFGIIWVPAAGQPLSRKNINANETQTPMQECDALRPAPAQTPYRIYTNGCPICLSAFEVNDHISWSHNPHCSHVFHTSCIHEWLAAAGRKYMRRLYYSHRRQQTHGIVLRQDPITNIMRMPLLCPCCRQPFLLNDKEEEQAKHGKLQQQRAQDHGLADASANVEDATNAAPAARADDGSIGENV